MLIILAIFIAIILIHMLPTPEPDDLTSKIVKAKGEYWKTLIEVKRLEGNIAAYDLMHRHLQTTQKGQ